jgi:hypothetical protein
LLSVSASFIGKNRFIAHGGFSRYCSFPYCHIYLWSTAAWLISIVPLLDAVIPWLIAIIPLLIAVIPLLIAIIPLAYRYYPTVGR